MQYNLIILDRSSFQICISSKAIESQAWQVLNLCQGMLIKYSFPLLLNVNMYIDKRINRPIAINRLSLHWISVVDLRVMSLGPKICLPTKTWNVQILSLLFKIQFLNLLGYLVILFKYGPFCCNPVFSRRVAKVLACRLGSLLLFLILLVVCYCKLLWDFLDRGRI